MHNRQSLWLTKMDRHPRTRQTAGETQAQRYENISQAEQSRRPPEWKKERRWVWERQAKTVKGFAVPLNSISSMGAELKLGKSLSVSYVIAFPLYTVLGGNGEPKHYKTVRWPGSSGARL